MKTMSATRRTQRWSQPIADEAQRTGHGTPARLPEEIRELPPARCGLVESTEYEWTSPLNLPGLLIAPQRIEPRPTPHGASVAPDEVIGTEDGDATAACQLPGRLGAVEMVAELVGLAALLGDELESIDEYSERAALQMPGGLIAAERVAPPATHIAPRGLCATCVHRAVCDFPRPEGGVWRCEEYA